MSAPRAPERRPPPRARGRTEVSARACADQTARGGESQPRPDVPSIEQITAAAAAAAAAAEATSAPSWNRCSRRLLWAAVGLRP